MKKLREIINKFKQKRRYKNCDHEWKTFDSGYKQCIHCKTIEKV